jgi:hypothetical protein
MTNWVSSEGCEIRAALDSGKGPIVVFDPCGEFWEQFSQESRWRPWRAWRFQPGQLGAFDGWDVLRELHSVSLSEGASVLANALFPESLEAPLTRKLMSYILIFVAETGYFKTLPELSGALWADDLWTVIARWSRHYPENHALRSARALLTLEGAADSIVAIRYRMMIFHHPNVAASFPYDVGLSLSTFRSRPAQIVFLTPPINILEDSDSEMHAVYAFIMESLRVLSALHYQPASLFYPTRITEGESS